MKTKIEEVLHFYIGCDVFVPSLNEYGRLVTISENEHCYLTMAIHGSTLSFFTNEFRPILRRLSSISDEQKIDCFKLVYGENNVYNKFGFDHVESLLLADMNGYRRVGIHMNAGMRFDLGMHLIKQGFWIFDESAFDSGMIIEKK